MVTAHVHVFARTVRLFGDEPDFVVTIEQRKRRVVTGRVEVALVVLG